MKLTTQKCWFEHFQNCGEAQLDGSRIQLNMDGWHLEKMCVLGWDATWRKKIIYGHWKYLNWGVEKVHEATFCKVGLAHVICHTRCQHCCVTQNTLGQQCASAVWLSVKKQKTENKASVMTGLLYSSVAVFLFIKTESIFSLCPTVFLTHSIASLCSLQ